jgi:hypothetical protein
MLFWRRQSHKACWLAAASFFFCLNDEQPAITITRRASILGVQIYARVVVVGGGGVPADRRQHTLTSESWYFAPGGRRSARLFFLLLQQQQHTVHQLVRSVLAPSVFGGLTVLSHTLSRPLSKRSGRVGHMTRQQVGCKYAFEGDCNLMTMHPPVLEPHPQVTNRWLVTLGGSRHHLP